MADRMLSTKHRTPNTNKQQMTLLCIPNGHHNPENKRSLCLNCQNQHTTKSNHKVIKASEYSFSKILMCSLKFSLMPG